MNILARFSSQLRNPYKTPEPLESARENPFARYNIAVRVITQVRVQTDNPRFSCSEMESI